jgi:hypothetical protein
MPGKLVRRCGMITSVKKNEAKLGCKVGQSMPGRPKLKLEEE